MNGNLERFWISNARNAAACVLARRFRSPLMALLMAAAACLPAHGATREAITALFSQANTHYQNGDYAGAEQLYRQAAEKGVDSGVLYYNIGNACFKQKKLGEAIYFWEKARRRLPRDPDVRENLELANLLVVDRIEVPPEPFPMRWLGGTVNRLTINQACQATLAAFVLANLLFSTFILARSRRAALRAVIMTLAAGCLFALFAGALAWRVIEKNTRQEGVVVEQKAEVRSGPGNENITVFTVHEGILLRVRGETGGWYQVILPNGWGGWLEKSVVRILD